MSSTIQKYVELLNNHDAEGLRALGAPESKIDLGGLEMDFAGDYIKALEEAWASFPDMKFLSGEITGGGDGKIYLKAMQYLGTHTGAPYGFGPYPRLEAAGVKCYSELEDMEFVVENDKIVDARLIPVEGALSGPPRFYTQIGGKLD
jgi:hypothetical protein